MTAIFRSLVVIAPLLLAFTGAAESQGVGAGPVAKSCAKDIDKFCAGMRHGSADVRTCLEANRAQVSKGCRQALDTTGGGRGPGRNR